MAGNKRTATRDINHENWNDEDEPEEAGEFQKAPEEVLKTRVFKTAKRRNLGSLNQSDEGGPKKSVFSAFSGFDKPASVPVSSAFSFLTKLTTTQSTEPPKVNGLSNTEGLMFKSSTTDSVDNKNDNLEEYYGKLKGLNESVSKFIQKHVETNPFINLQPIFKDYDKYIDELEALRNKLSNQAKKTTENTSSNSNISNTETNQFSSFVFKPATSKTVSESSLSTSSTATVSPDDKQSKSNQFSFGSSSAQFSFGANKPAALKPSGFSFGLANTAASAINSEQSKEKNDNDEQEDNEDQPPKVEFTPVIEENHVYTTRCKVFVKKDGNFADKGVGNLFLKPIPDSPKFQLIVRADTNLGNLLCNFILSESIPTQRMGKKDVMLICLPMPDAKPPPVPILLRVKSPEDADKLLEVLEKHKK